MRPVVARVLGVYLTVLSLSCGETGQGEVQVPVFAQGTRARDVAIDGATLRLTKAEVAFGPLYLCATESAESELCGTALAELLRVDTCDALSPKEQAFGSLEGTTGSVRSGFFDYGITWGLTQQAPRASEGSVRGHSAHLEGRIALADGTELSFLADIDILPLAAGDAAVNGLETRHTLSDDTRSLTVSFDPNDWLRRIKLDAVLALEIEEGKVRFEPGSQPYEAIIQAMTANAPPSLSFED